MKYRITTLICVLCFLISIIGCGKKEESTITGMVVSVDGTIVSLQQFDNNMANRERPQMPEGELPEDFNPEDFEGKMPQMPQGELPEDFNPEDFEGKMPQMPQGELPEDFNPEDFEGKMPQMPEGEKTEIDLSNAHISMEIDGGKATGSMEDITEGSFLTITINKKGEATNVLISSNKGFYRENRNNNNSQEDSI